MSIKIFSFFCPIKCDIYDDSEIKRLSLVMKYTDRLDESVLRKRLKNTLKRKRKKKYYISCLDEKKKLKIAMQKIFTSI